MSNTTHIKFEHSPTDSLADSFVSTPGTIYPPLFNDTMDPAEAMTPQSPYDEDSMFGGSMNGESSMAGTPAPEKKPVKKRKSWGQQLPEPKTNLPPRKRAKTEDEKEQRRVERVLRNRRAAQSSRERKRQEVEALENEKRAIERRNADLEMRLADMQAKNELLMRELEQFTGGMTVFRSSSIASTPAQAELRSAPTPVTFSQELFGSRDAQERPISTQPIIKAEPAQTVNPASLSPEIRPVVESASASSSDMTQHPAVSVGRTTALDGFNDSHNFSHLSNLGNQPLHQYDFGGYFDAPDPTASDRHFFENGIAPIADQFDLNYDHLVSHDDGGIDDFDLDDFLHHDDQPAPEIHSSDSLAETTANLQPPLGASSFGCDDGGNAVSV
ncbi:hypothetical protein F5882DRAFT_417765 [Hyaloscypha sp. PMI_1271]|nr:hypothetical protein F5882DRAFT_417765 [Hyaloscypha sp. PMI_1271]